jgi:hypothetical protein
MLKPLLQGFLKDRICPWLNKAQAQRSGTWKGES